MGVIRIWMRSIYYVKATGLNEIPEEVWLQEGSEAWHPGSPSVGRLKMEPDGAASARGESEVRVPEPKYGEGELPK